MRFTITYPFWALKSPSTLFRIRYGDDNETDVVNTNSMLRLAYELKGYNGHHIRLDVPMIFPFIKPRAVMYDEGDVLANGLADAHGVHLTISNGKRLSFSFITCCKRSIVDQDGTVIAAIYPKCGRTFVFIRRSARHLPVDCLVGMIVFAHAIDTIGCD